MKYYRRCIRICAEDSPNVQRGLEQEARGGKADGATVIPGVLSWAEYKFRRRTWDAQRQCEGLDARWYEGPTIKLVPKLWLDAAEAWKRPPVSSPRWMGIDTGEGGDDSAWCVVDRFGVLELLSYPTPDTNVVVGQTLQLIRKHGVLAENVCFDRGGGGKEHADRLRAMGFNVRTIGFGQSVSTEPKRGIRVFPEKREIAERKYAFVRRRDEMYYGIRELLSSHNDDMGGREEVLQALTGQKKLEARPKFHLPVPLCTELRRQLECVPLRYDAEGRFKLIPKRNPNDEKDQDTFAYLIGRSPDQADAFALAVFAMTHKPVRQVAGAR